MERDEYAVYRTRTMVDRDGGLVSAHYGMIYGGSCNLYANKGMRIGGVFFNPSPNDTNLEHSEAARRSRIALGQMLERKAKAETCR